MRTGVHREGRGWMVLPTSAAKLLLHARYPGLRPPAAPHPRLLPHLLAYSHPITSSLIHTQLPCAIMPTHLPPHAPPSSAPSCRCRCCCRSPTVAHCPQAAAHAAAACWARALGVPEDATGLQGHRT